jgi:hypothetical protein
MLSHSSTGAAVVDAQEDLLRASAMANETPVPAITRVPIRRNVALLAAAGALAAASCGLAALGSADGSPVVVVAGLIGLGIANGPARLIRTAGGDMYPPERRARGIALVLFGAVFGGILGRRLSSAPCWRA